MKTTNNGKDDKPKEDKYVASVRSTHTTPPAIPPRPKSKEESNHLASSTKTPISSQDELKSSPAVTRSGDERKKFMADEAKKFTDLKSSIKSFSELTKALEKNGKLDPYRIYSNEYYLLEAATTGKSIAKDKLVNPESYIRLTESEAIMLDIQIERHIAKNRELIYRDWTDDEFSTVKETVELSSKFQVRADIFKHFRNQKKDRILPMESEEAMPDAVSVSATVDPKTTFKDTPKSTEATIKSAISSQKASKSAEPSELERKLAERRRKTDSPKP